jgi:hypothetical protein
MAFAGWSAREPMNFECNRLCFRPLQNCSRRMTGVEVDLKPSTLIEVGSDEQVSVTHTPAASLKDRARRKARSVGKGNQRVRVCRGCASRRFAVLTHLRAPSDGLLSA